ncbi:MAG TPA: VOC family protein [Gaiellaceae bacterium]|jgi:catechol 2,3-dioxygenase|nr:VOC family protein [Gaiellaceae bacterium]
MSPDARMGLVELTVSDLERSLEYWQRAVGLRVLLRDAGTAELGTDAPLLRFVEEQGATPADGFTGLYHVALLVPDRPALARFLAHVAREGIPLEGLSDHEVSEAIYLRDPDRHGIEIYADRPRKQWDGRVLELMTTKPLDAESLLGEQGGEAFDGLSEGTTVGHVHFRVRDVDEAVGFYRDVLGMGLMAQLGRAAAFLSAGGYHHHVGVNSWETRGASPAPGGTATLRHATIALTGGAERDRLAAAVAETGQEPEQRDDGILVRDPSGNRLLLVA